MIPFANVKRTYVLAPADSTSGGPELLHQLVYTLNTLGAQADIVYYGADHSSPPPAYSRYVKGSVPFGEIEDSEENLIVVPEVSIHLLSRFKKAAKAIWWLSVDNFYILYRDKSFDALSFLFRTQGFFAVLKRLLKISIKHISFASPAIQQARAHLCQSHYAMDWCKRHGLTKVYGLSDYLADDYLGLTPEVAQKEDLVVYNPKKGASFTKKLIRASPDLTFAPIIGMSRQEVIRLLLRAKVYIDFGNHPGKDRIPREARMAGCVVVTGTDGAARFDADVPIQEKIPARSENIRTIRNLIGTVMSDYATFNSRQSAYAEQIKRGKGDFVSQVKSLWGL